MANQIIIVCNQLATFAFMLMFTTILSVSSVQASDNELVQDWMQTIGEWADDERDGTVQLIAIHQGLEDLRQTLTLRWTILDREKKTFHVKSQTNTLNICGSEAFQDVKLITFSGLSSERIDLALTVRYLPEFPDQVFGKSQLVFLSIDNKEKQISVLNCHEN